MQLHRQCSIAHCRRKNLFLQLGVCKMQGPVCPFSLCLPLSFAVFKPRKMGVEILYQIQLLFDLLCMWFKESAPY